MKKFLLCSLCLLISLTFVACSQDLMVDNSVVINSSSLNSSSISQSFTSNLDSSIENSTETSIDSTTSEVESVSKSESASNKPSEPENLSKTYLLSCVDSLCVRSLNSVNSTVLGYLDKGDLCTYISKAGEFYKTKYKEKTAYVSTKYCEKVEFDLSSLEVEKTIDFACNLLGYPYVFGSERYHWGNGKLNTNFKNGEFDCSALVQYVYFKSCGVLLDVTSRAQSLNGNAVSKANLKRGDLMFFTNDSRKNKSGIERIGHVGIYFGDNYILHTASDHAVIEEISQKRWSYYITARRVV